MLEAGPKRSRAERAFMKTKKTSVIRVGQKLLNKRHKTVYVVRNIEENSIVLVSEDGTKSLRVPVGSISRDEYDTLYD